MAAAEKTDKFPEDGFILLKAFLMCKGAVVAFGPRAAKGLPLFIRKPGPGQAV